MSVFSVLVSVANGVDKTTNNLLGFEEFLMIITAQFG